MPPTPPFDWNQIRDIKIQFGSFHTKGNADKHVELNKSFSHYLEDTDGLFITDEDAEGPKTLAPDPATMLKETIVNAIMDIIPAREQTEINKGHISTLFADATFWHVDTTQSARRLRNKNAMDRAGEQAISNGQDAFLIEIRVTHWGFKPDWDPLHFDEVYDANIYNFPELNDETPTLPAPAPATTGTDMQQLTTLLQQLVDNSNTNNNNNNSAGANHQASLNLPWNPATLPPPVKDRYYKRDEFLTRDDMKDFPITYTDSSGNETVIRQNYYLHNLGSGRNDQRLITRSGDCFDLTRASDKSKEAARDKLFLSGFPQLKDATDPQVRKWYREITAHSQQHHIYVHPYYLFRREADHLRGFTIGDDLPHDLPSRYELAINEWGNLIYTALRTDKIIPDSCASMKATIQSFEGGQGYEALYTVIAQTHPNSKRPSNASRMVRNPPNQDPNESLEEYYFRYKDYLRLRVFLQNQPSTISSTEEVSNLIAGTTLSEELFKKTEDERDSDDQFKRDKYKAGRFLQTLQTYEQEIKAEQKYKRNTSKPIQPKQLPVSGTRPGHRRNDRFQKRASNSTVRTPSTLTSHSISLIESLGYPEMDEESDDPFLHQAYCNAITAFDKQPSLFDTSRKCIVCHMSGHNFDNCPALQDIESLKKHRIAAAVFLNKSNKQTQQLLDSTQQISQINIGDEDQDEVSPDAAVEGQNFCNGQE
eukprot:jgi/Psemu1/27241/gm1.27241_g